MSNDEEKKAAEEKFAPAVILERPVEPKPAVVTPPPAPPRGGSVRVVALSFHAAGKLYDFEVADGEFAPGDSVVVETEEGLGFAQVVLAPRQEDRASFQVALKKVIRKSNFDDLRQHQKNAEREKLAAQMCRERIQRYGLKMKLIHVEYLHSGAKALVFFSSEERVDFRNLVRELAQELHTRIEMKQVGPRDEAKMMGAIGVCGRELCCSTWLRSFDPISIKMAKEQDLSLNPSKLAGQCGRLKCCLAYEYETYVHLKRGLPKVGKKVCWKDGTPCGRVSGHNVFSGTVRILDDDGTERVVPLSDIQPVIPRGREDRPEERSPDEHRDEAPPVVEAHTEDLPGDLDDKNFPES